MNNIWRRFMEKTRSLARPRGNRAESGEVGSTAGTAPSSEAVRRERLLWLGAAAAAHLVLLTALVYSLLSDWPGRLWLVLGVIVAVALSALLAQRWHRAPVWIALCALAVLVLVASYLYGTGGAGLRIVGIRFDTLIALLFLAAIGLAVWQLASLPRLPWWSRLIPVALGIHAVIPVVMGLFEGIPFEDVLVGLWTLPYWAQGAWLGAAVLLPAALASSVATALIPSWRPDPFRKATAVATGLALLWMTLVTGLGMNYRGLVNLTGFLRTPEPPAKQTAQLTEPPDSVPEPPPRPTQEPVPGRPPAEQQRQAEASFADLTGEERQQKIAELERLFDALEAAAKEIPRDTFDPRAIVDQVGTDPVKLFEWVRDNTYLVPYQGTLRGPVGVLMDRMGNSLDRALLLLKFLELTGHEARLARARLPDGQVREVFGTLPTKLTDTASMPETPTSRGARPTLEVAESFRVDPEVLRQELGVQVLEHLNQANSVAARAKRQAAALATVLTVPAGDADWQRADTLEALEDHWWVQWWHENSWVDLDTVLPDAAPGLALPAASTLEPDEIPADLVHLLQVRVIAEQWREGELLEHQLLEHTVRPSDMTGQTIVLSNAPINWPQDLNPAVKDTLGAFKQAVLAQEEWLPVLTVGRETYFDKSITTAGDPRERPGSGAAAGGPLNLWSATSSSLRSDDRTEGPSHFVGEWIRVSDTSSGPAESDCSAADLRLGRLSGPPRRWEPGTADA